MEFIRSLLRYVKGQKGGILPKEGLFLYDKEIYIINTKFRKINIQPDLNL